MATHQCLFSLLTERIVYICNLKEKKQVKKESLKIKEGDWELDGIRCNKISEEIRSRTQEEVIALNTVLLLSINVFACPT